MDTNELLALRARCWTAKVNKHLIGAAASYVAALEKEAGPVDFRGREHSPDHLIALVEKVIRARKAPKVAEVQVSVKPAPEKKTAPKVEAKVAVPKPTAEKKG